MPISVLAARLRHRTSDWTPEMRGLAWSMASGLLFCLLNATTRQLTLDLPTSQAQFLRYLFGLLVLLPVMLRRGIGQYMPRQMAGQFTRGALHTLGLYLWYAALPHIPLADTTAIGFTSPIFIMIGAWLFFREPMRWERWLATAIGFGGVLIVVAPKLSGQGGGWQLLMLASAPIFAASFLLTKALTRHESTGVILVWQAITVSLFSLPLALWQWAPVSPWQWAAFVLSGLLGSAGHYCLTRSYAAADISATQSAKFLDLVWSAAIGWLLFADLPSQSTLIGGGVICASTLWVARRERQRQGA
jgi:drug/metabolite transporter (DMT)-like permease